VTDAPLPYEPFRAAQPGTQVSIRALLIADRIDVTGLERRGLLSDAPLERRAGSRLVSESPLAFRAGSNGFVVVFRYGVVVLVCLSAPEEEEVLRTLRPRAIGTFARHEEETATIELSADHEDHVPPGGSIKLQALTVERVLVIADVLAKSTALARDEHEVAAVFDVIDPFSRKLAEKGRLPKARKRILQHIGNALQLQHRLSGRVAAEEKPDVLWDRHDLERLYTRLEDEYELKGRADALHRKLAVIAESAKVLTDLIDAQHSKRIEIIITLLIVSEVVLSLFQIWADRGH
jgi:uncharacterized Rmd1/YagE family protein